MRVSVIKDGQVWDVVPSRKNSHPFLIPVFLVRGKERDLLCQVSNDERFGWSVVVSGLREEIRGIRLVEGFKHRWQAIKYAIDIRLDLNKEAKYANSLSDI